MAFDPTLLQGLTASLEAIVNTALHYDPSSQQKLARIDRVLAITVTESATIPTLTLYLQGRETGVAILHHCEMPISAHLQGSVPALMTLLNQPTTLANSNVTLIGSTSLLQQWQDILNHLDIDWEDAISQLMGDIAGPLTASSIRASIQWANVQAQEQKRLITEYLQEELRLTPSQPEAEHFYQAIGYLTLDVDRLSAKFQKLQQHYFQTIPQEDVE